MQAPTRPQPTIGAAIKKISSWPSTQTGTSRRGATRDAASTPAVTSGMAAPPGDCANETDPSETDASGATGLLPPVLSRLVDGPAVGCTWVATAATAALADTVRLGAVQPLKTLPSAVAGALQAVVNITAEVEEEVGDTAAAAAAAVVEGRCRWCGREGNSPR